MYGLELYNLWRSFRASARELARANERLRDALHKAQNAHWSLQLDAKKLMEERENRPLATAILKTIRESPSIDVDGHVWSATRDLDAVVELLGQESEAGR